MSRPLPAPGPLLAVVRYGAPNVPVWVGRIEGRDDSRPLMLQDCDQATLRALALGDRATLGAWHYIEAVVEGTTRASLAAALLPAPWEA